jgi:hypothetical protein
MSRVHGGGSVQIWACTDYNRVQLTPTLNHMDNEEYTSILGTWLLPVADTIGGPKWRFQHDNAEPHHRHGHDEFIEANQIRTVDHSALSPDLNVQENVWGMVVRVVYAEGRQYKTLAELREGIDRAFLEIDMQQVQRLSETMSDRVAEVLIRGGKATSYQYLRLRKMEVVSLYN